MDRERRTGVLLVNTGTPSAPTPHAVRVYLRRFLSNKRIVPMNRVAWWLILNLFILPRRGRVSAKKYETIWTPDGSPFAIAHEALQRGVDAELAKRGFEACVRQAMSFSDPLILDAMRELREAGCTELLVLPLYPQSAFSTTKVVEDGVSDALRKMHWSVPVEIVPEYCDHPTYIGAIAASIERAGFDVSSDDKLLFSYHSIPLADVEAGDTYELQTGSTSLHVANELSLERSRWTIGYQCRFDKGRDWLSPTTVDALDRFADVGTGRVFVVCPNFAVDCLETLYDIEQELKPYYLYRRVQLGYPTDTGYFTYVPCLGNSKAHVRVLCDVLESYLSE